MKRKVKEKSKDKLKAQFYLLDKTYQQLITEMQQHKIFDKKLK